MKKDNKLLNKINEYLGIDGIGGAIEDGVELIMRLNLGQMSTVLKILERYCSIQKDGKGPCLSDILYKALELAGYIECYQKFGDCELVDDCWITRKGFCKKKRGRNGK